MTQPINSTTVPTEVVLSKYVITCGDEGVQINEGRRLAFVGAGFQLKGFSEVVKILKKILDKELRIVSSQENDWIKAKLDLQNWQQVNAMMQQHIDALADKEGLLYSGYLPFTDPRKLEYDVKGHMVRPHNVHIANKICFTLGGGEQIYNLGHFQISADWVAEAPKALVKEVILPQVEFYKALAKRGDLPFVFSEKGELGETVAAKNKAALAAVGIK
ncbi:MAG TPA: hypothetical protein DEP87_01980 [Candidatus Pacebacteria bacterium]|nr:hypothetical protein [Candidatus Paceibacterota bacterium]